VPIPLSRAERQLGSDLELRVDPRRIMTYATGKLPGVRRARARLAALPFPVPGPIERRLLDGVARRHPFVLTASDYPAHWPVAEDPKYLRLEDLLDHLDAPESTTWWSYALERIAEDGHFRMKDGPVTDEAGLRRHLETYLLPLIAAFERDGYRADVDDEPGRVHVGQDGSLHKTNKGAHRFLLARRYGGEPLRVRVMCVHADWWRASTSGRTDRDRLESARDALRGVAEAHRG
jgi:hypothetical protein